jgi:hypothetical protein
LDAAAKRLDDAAMRPCRLLLPLLWLAAMAAGQEPTQTFRNLNASFHIELPAGWRQVSPNEARTIGARPEAPARLGFAQPRHFYAVGPVDAWLAGDFTGPWLYVVEQDHEWYITDDFARDLAAMWEAEGAATGDRHELADVQRLEVGPQQVEVVVATRRNTPAGGRPVVTSLDVHAPAGGRQITLSFCCRPEDFARHEASFRRWLGTLTFARLARTQASLGDRLWTPLLTGGAVGLVLLVLYKHTRGRR